MASPFIKAGIAIDNVEAAFTLIQAEASRRIKALGGDYCGKLTEVSQEVDQKLLQLMKLTREEERRKKNAKNIFSTD